MKLERDRLPMTPNIALGWNAPVLGSHWGRSFQMERFVPDEAPPARRWS
jgi:hypothetical protein